MVPLGGDGGRGREREREEEMRTKEIYVGEGGGRKEAYQVSTSSLVYSTLGIGSPL